MKRRHIILIALFIVYFLLRLSISLRTPYFDTGNSYYALRQIEHIAATGRPLIHDDLSAGGRTFIFMPLYYYFLAFFYKIVPSVWTIKVINNLLASSIIPAVYMVGTEVVKNRRIALVTALLAGTIPLYISQTLHAISPFSFLFPSAFFMLYYFIRLRRDDQVLNPLLALTILLVLSSPTSFLILFGLMIYLLLSWLEDIKRSRLQIEFIVFFLFFFLWAHFIIYKNAFLMHGFRIIWNNTPDAILSDYFAGIHLAEALTSIGIVSLLLGTYTSFTYLFRVKSKNIYLFISMFVSTLILFLTRLVSSELSLIFIGSILVVLFGRFLRDFLSQLRKSKFSHLRNWFALGITLLVVLTQTVPGLIVLLNDQTPPEPYFEGFIWLKNTPESSTILSPPEEGHYITYFGNRSNVIDTDFLLLEDAEGRVEGGKRIYTTRFKIEAIRLLDKYSADYLVFSDAARKNYDIEEISYIDDQCFSLTYNESIQIYRWRKERCAIQN